MFLKGEGCQKIEKKNSNFNVLTFLDVFLPIFMADHSVALCL